MGDVADQAEQLSAIMEAEAVHEGLLGHTGIGEGDELPYPLEDVEELLAMEDADDASDDPFHAGGLNPEPWRTAEQAAMHVVDGDALERDEDGDPEELSHHLLTPEDETLLGIDPYEE